MHVFVSGLIASVLLAAVPASAAERWCKGEAAAGAQTVEVTYRVDGRGRVSSSLASWEPPRREADDGAPSLRLGFAFSDQGLSQLRDVAVSASVELDPIPASNSAMIRFELDGVTVGGVPWGMFATHAVPSARAELVKGYTVAGFAGAIPVARLATPDIPELNTGMLGPMAKARVVRVVVEGDAPGEIFGVGTFDIADTSQRDALFNAAYPLAARALQTWRSCAKIPRY